MKYKALIIMAALSFVTVSVAAQNSSSNNQAVEISPGLIGASSPMYGLETAWDNAAVNIGVKKAGNVAQERAAEAKQAQEKGNTKAVERATTNLEKIAKKAKKGDEEGLNKAMKIMEGVIANAPNEQARQGMQNALENMRNAQDKRSEARAEDRRTENRDRMERQNRSESMERDSGNTTNSTREEQQTENGSETQNQTTENPR